MKSFLAILCSILLFAFLHVLALHFYFYWTVWWFDIFMHVFGGFIFGTLFAYSLLQSVSSRGKSFLLIVCGAFVAGIVWEIFEYKVGLTFTTSGNYTFDTASDLLSDIVGGLLAYILWINRFSNNYEQKS